MPIWIRRCRKKSGNIYYESGVKNELGVLTVAKKGGSIAMED